MALALLCVSTSSVCDRILTSQTYGTQAEAEAAIQAMNEQELDGRRVRVNMANSKPAGGGYGGGYGSGCA